MLNRNQKTSILTAFIIFAITTSLLVFLNLGGCQDTKKAEIKALKAKVDPAKRSVINEKLEVLSSKKEIKGKKLQAEKINTSFLTKRNSLLLKFTDSIPTKDFLVYDNLVIKNLAAKENIIKAQDKVIIKLDTIVVADSSIVKYQDSIINIQAETIKHYKKKEIRDRLIAWGSIGAFLTTLIIAALK